MKMGIMYCTGAFLYLTTKKWRVATSVQEVESMDTVRLAFEQDLSRFVKFIKSESKEENAFERAEKLANKEAKCHTALYNLWNTYEPKLSKGYLEEKFLIIGEFLYSAGEYGLAVSHCFMKYLVKFGRIEAPYHLISNGLTFDQFRELFFPKGLDNEDAVNVIRTLLGISISRGCQAVSDDSKLKNSESLATLLNCLKVIQFTTQMALKKEILCWLVYNGTVHIYAITRHMMSHGYCKQALEYALWACICMESSVPLMTVKYLTWRCQLYTAVCHCYYDLNAAAEAEAFAKRALNLVEELQEIGQMSTSNSEDNTERIFKGAKLKMKILIFKRNVYESRRRPKGILRPKNKPPLKELTHNPWPRTTTERMLSETFPGRAAQLLAVIEALTDSKRRIFQTTLGAPESDDSILDVFAELFFAGCELIAGGGGTRPPSPGRHESVIGDAVEDDQLIKMAVKGDDTISYSSVVHFIRLAYNYECWEAFESLAQPAMNLLRPMVTSEKHLVEFKSLEILQAMLPLNMNKVKKKVLLGMDDKEVSEIHSTKQSSTRISSFVDDILKLVDVMESCVTGEKSKRIIPGITDILVDTCLFVWSRCKNHFSRVTSSSGESFKHVLQDVNMEKWIRILVVTQKTMIEVGLAATDISACAEVSIKLALLIEFFCSDNQVVMELKGNKSFKQAQKSEDANQVNTRTTSRVESIANGLGCSPNPQSMLSLANQRLKIAINAVDEASSSNYDENFTIADDSLLKEPENDSSISKAGPVLLDASAMNLELVYVHHRIDCRLSQLKSDSKEEKTNFKKAEKYGISACAGKSNLSKAVYLICKVESNRDGKSEENGAILKESLELIQKAWKMETKLLMESSRMPKDTGQPYPPAPKIVYRSATTMMFKPGVFNQEVHCYKLFVRSYSGNNVKVRLSDTQFPGTGIEALNSEGLILKVYGLTPNEKYVAAVAAYDKRGQLIGESVGQTSSPFLASSPLPIAIAYGYLAKVAYDVGCWDLAKASFSVLWKHFVLNANLFKQENNVMSAREDTALKLHQLNMGTIERASTSLIRYFLQAIFISVDISIREGALFCDSFCDFKPPYAGQNARLEECKKLLIALNIAGLINDNTMCLQAVIQCYGLLVPLLQMEIHVKPVLEVMTHCFAALQELQPVIRSRKASSISENLHHMVSAITFYIAKVLDKKKQRFGVIRILESGCKILSGDPSSVAPDSAATSNNTAFGSGTQKRLTKKGTLKKLKMLAGKSGMKGANEIMASETIANELKIIEGYLHKIKKEADYNTEEDSLELTGIEEAQYVHAVLSCLPPQAAFKEVSKFKRRTQYLEHFVDVLARALNEGLQTLMVDWTKDALTWLTRRNEVLLNKQSADQRGGTVIVAVDDEKNRKYSAAVVEYGKTSKSLPNRDLLPIAETQMNKSNQKHAEKKSRAKGPVQLTEEERRTKDATQKLRDLLPEHYKTAQRRRRLRSVTFEELPWRAQLNMLMARCFVDLSWEKFKAAIRIHNLTENFQSSNLMDLNWFTLATAEALIVSWAGIPQLNETELEPTIDIGGRSIDHTDVASTTLRIDHISGKGKIVMKSRTSQTGKASKRDQDDGGQNLEDPIKMYLGYINTALIYLKRCMVLARRGKNWVLLQNAARELYNISHVIHKRVVSLASSDMLKNNQVFPLSIANVRELFWYPFYLAADCLLDMLIYRYWNMKEKIGNKSYTVTSSEKLFDSGIKDHSGGFSLHFDEILDDSSATNLIWLKKIIWYAIEMLYHEEKWEKVVDLIYRFSALTRDRFAETLLPILIFAQRRIEDRLQSYPGPPKEQPRVIFDKETGIPMAAFLDPPSSVSIDAGAHIDPEGHNLYNPSVEGKAVSCVPINVNESMQRLFQALNTKKYSARALEHCRKLLLLFLAGKQNGMSSKAKLRLGSRVSFVASQVQPQDVVPPDLGQTTFEDREDVEKYPLGNNQLAIVISAYDKTIEILKYRKQTSLAVQAMHELGNILIQSDNMRLAYKWWAEALDSILQTKDSLKSWRKLVDDGNSIRSSHTLLDRCGIWGCLLGAVLASKIARYIHTFDLGVRSQFCQLSAALFQALLCTSLPHPSPHLDYANYDIGSIHRVKDLIPGVDLFSDPFRADCGTVLGSLFWTANELIRAGFYLKVLPLLSICQYLCVDVCKETKRAVQVKILRVNALVGLNLFSEAIKHLEDIFTGYGLPSANINKQLKGAVTSQKFGYFDNSRKVIDSGNFKVLKEICYATLTNSRVEAYGCRVSKQIELAQAHVLNAIASTINDVAESEVLIRSPSIAKDEVVDVKRSNSKSKRISYKKKTTRSKAGSPAVQPRIESTQEELQSETSSKIKGMLLGNVERIAKKIITRIKESQADAEPTESSRISPDDLELLCECEMELAKAADSRFVSITAARHIFNAMKQIQLASLLEDNEDTEEFQKLPWLSDNSNGDGSIVHANPEVNIDALLWLKLRLKIAEYLSNYVTIPLDDEPIPAESSIGTADYHISQGLEEADAFNVQEFAARFRILRTLNAMRIGEDIETIIDSLEALIKELRIHPTISFDSFLTLLMANVLFTDLQLVNGTLVGSDAEIFYKSLLDEILNQVVHIGNDIIPRYQTLTKSLSNIYNPLLSLTVAVKLRISKCRALSIENTDSEIEQQSQDWLNVDSMLLDALDISQKISVEVPAVEMEIVFLRGLLTRQLYELEKVDFKYVIESLVGAVKMHLKHTPDLSFAIACQASAISEYDVQEMFFQVTERLFTRTLYESYSIDCRNMKSLENLERKFSMVRQLYQEISLVCMTFYERNEAVYLKMETSSKQNRLEEGDKEKERSSNSGKSSSYSGQALTKQALQQQKLQQAKRDKEARIRERQQQSIRKAAWVAARTAGAIAKAQKKFEYLASDALLVSEEMMELIAPDFAIFDILKTDAVVPDQETGLNVNGGIVLTENRFGKKEFFKFSWLHVINYTRALKRQTSYFGMGLGSSKLSLRSAFFSERCALKMKVMHNFLKESLTIYAKECCPILPVEFFMNLEYPTFSSQTLPAISIVPETEDADGKRGASNTDVIQGTVSPPANQKEADQPSTIGRDTSTDFTRNQSPVKQADRSDRIHTRDPLQAGEYEIAIQWHRPELSIDNKTTFLFAMNNKGISINDKAASFAAFVTVDRVPISWPVDLHHSLTELFHTAESEFNQQPGMLAKTAVAVQAASAISSVSPTRKRKPFGIKPISVEQDKEDQIRLQLKTILDKIHDVFQKAHMQDVPFEISFQNISCMEKLFNPNFGNISKTNEAFFLWLQFLLNGN